VHLGALNGSTADEMYLLVDSLIEMGMEGVSMRRCIIADDCELANSITGHRSSLITFQRAQRTIARRRRRKHI
jgi:hypothetical protein